MPAIAVSHAVVGEGPPVYFAHGIGARKTGWDAMVAHLADRYTCVTYDQRGHGESPIPPVPYSLDELVDDLEALRATLGHEQIHVVGHSLGGQIGPAYARAFPERTLSVSLLSTAAFRTEEDSAKVKGVVAAIRAEGAAKILPTLVDRWFTEPFAAGNPDAIEARLQQVLNTPEDVFAAVFDIYAGVEMGAWLNQVDVPCLVLTGENDGGCNPRLNRLIDAALPDSELVIVPELRHSILIEAPGLVAGHVGTFLDRVS
ncbi:MAG: alpha/beta fold hydrolase [Pseudomonadota bacterium]